MHVGTDILALHHLLEVTYDIHIEYVDGEIVLLAHGGSSEVHYLKTTGVNLIVGNLAEFGGSGVLLGVGGVDTVNAGTLQHHVGLNLNAAQA